jgi:RNA-dependent RNA polymerase
MNWLLIADQNPDGIFHSDCLKLSALHSDAVDYPKSGQPVLQSAIPKLHFRGKPDWNAPETVRPDSSKYYVSNRAIGRLFRDIDLPTLPLTQLIKQARKPSIPREADEVTEALDRLDFSHDPVTEAIEDRVSEFLQIQDNFPSTVQYIKQIFDRYASELHTICVANALSHKQSALLTEEEAVVGTIVQKSSQPRKRKDMMSKLREQTDILVRGVREELAGDDTMTPREGLEQAWLAWQLSILEHESFGGQSFGWIALGAIFEVIKEIEESESRSIN